MVHQALHNDVTARGMFLEEYNCVPAPVLQLKLRRTALLEDTFRQLEHADYDNFKKTFLVRKMQQLSKKWWLLLHNYVTPYVIFQKSLFITNKGRILMENHSSIFRAYMCEDSCVRLEQNTYDVSP